MLLPTPRPRTQKARGYFALRQACQSVPPAVCYRADALANALMSEITAALSFPLFARPCPTRPRHGFVESRTIYSPQELGTLARETLMADPDTEILIMNRIEASVSAIVTPNAIMIGPGHDGATQGRDTLTVPTVSPAVPLPSAVLMKAGVTCQPYLELVWDGDQRYLVQLRDGPPAPVTRDFIPAKVTVREIVEPNGETLLEWEERIVALAGKPGVAVSHPGSSLASHYAVHAIAAGIPYVTSRPVSVGETLLPEQTSTVASIPEVNRGVHAAYGVPFESTERAVHHLTALMLLTARHAGAWYGRADFVLGLGLGAAVRATHAICRAEARFAKSLKGKVPPGRQGNWDGSLNLKRSPRWEAAIKLFRNSSEWAGGYGGPRWAAIAACGARIEQAVAYGDIGRAVQSLNVLVDLHHNGGWAFNKTGCPRKYLESDPGPVALELAPLLYVAYLHRNPEAKVPPKWYRRPLLVKLLEESVKLEALAAKAAAAKQAFHYVSCNAALIAYLEKHSQYVTFAQARPIPVGTEKEYSGPMVRVQVRLVDDDWAETTYSSECLPPLARPKLFPSMAGTDKLYREVKRG